MRNGSSVLVLGFKHEFNTLKLDIKEYKIYYAFLFSKRLEAFIQRRDVVS